MTTNNDLDQAREWAKWIIQADSQVEVDPDLRGAANVIQSLPDEWIDADNLADEGRLMPDLSTVTRITVAGDGKRQMEEWNLHDVELHIQDEGRTLKVFYRTNIEEKE